MVKEFWDSVADQPALLQAANVRLERERLVAAPQVKASNIEAHPRADARRTLGSCSTGGLPSLKLESYAVRKRVALRFLHLHQNILLQIRSFGILHSSIHLTKDA